MTHIFNESSKTIDFHPSSSGWDPSGVPEWRMHFATSGNAIITKIASSDAVLSLDSTVLRKLSSIFRPLESIENLLVTWNSQASLDSYYPAGTLSVSLPRCKLSFFVNAYGNLECRELLGHSITPKQSVGALFGLKSKIVLENVDGVHPLKIIIPCGTIVTSMGSTSHPEHVIETSTALDHIQTLFFDVDDVIGRLIPSDGTLSSWLTLINLHIITSSHLCDPLTDRTGVQQAVSMLQSAQTFAFTRLDSGDLELFRKIQALSPVRRYSNRSRLLENVHWHPTLSVLSQSDYFVPLVEAVLEYAQALSMFSPTMQKLSGNHEGDESLRRRAGYRNARFFHGRFSRSVY